MGCKGYCEQGKKPCQLPEDCDDDLGAALGIMRAVAFTAVVLAAGAFVLTLLLNWGNP